MSVQRKILSEHKYKGRTITTRHMGPDCLSEVDGVELANFYLNPAAGRAAGERYVDQLEKDKKLRR